MKKKTSVRYVMSYSQWDEMPPFSSRQSEKIIAKDDNEALMRFNSFKMNSERCGNFKLVKIIREARHSLYDGLTKRVITITEIQLA